MKNIKTFESFIAEGLSVRDNGIRDGILFIDINGNEYGYSEIKGGADLEEIARKFRKMLQFSSGRALAWLKKNTDLAAGSKKNEAEDIKAAIGSMVAEAEVAELLEACESIIINEANGTTPNFLISVLNAIANGDISSLTIDGIKEMGEDTDAFSDELNDAEDGNQWIKDQLKGIGISAPRDLKKNFGLIQIDGGDAEEKDALKMAKLFKFYGFFEEDERFLVFSNKPISLKADKEYAGMGMKETDLDVKTPTQNADFSKYFLSESLVVEKLSGEAIDELKGRVFSTLDKVGDLRGKKLAEIADLRKQNSKIRYGSGPFGSTDDDKKRKAKENLKNEADKLEKEIEEIEKRVKDGDYPKSTKSIAMIYWRKVAKPEGFAAHADSKKDAEKALRYSSHDFGTGLKTTWVTGVDNIRKHIMGMLNDAKKD